MNSNLCTTMLATVYSVSRCSLTVHDQSNHQEVVVHSDCACHFRVGDRVCIHYNGVMTNSIPPQISATCIECVC